MRAAWVVIGVALVLASGCAQQDWIDRTLVTVDVTGVWEGSYTRSTGGQFGGVGSTGGVVFVLQQRGAKVTGQMKFNRESLIVQIEGTVSGDTLTFHATDSGPAAHGEFQVNGDEMIGSWSRLTIQTATLRRQQ